MKRNPGALIPLALCIASLAACVTASPEQRAAQATLDRARAAYDAGDYQRTISLLSQQSREIGDADRDTQVSAHKLMAFSYCVTNRIIQCRNEFSKVLEIDRHFELSPAERGHPIWGPAFEAARRKQGLS